MTDLSVITGILCCLTGILLYMGMGVWHAASHLHKISDMIQKDVIAKKKYMEHDSELRRKTAKKLDDYYGV